jgi:hypothetical protein
MFVRTKKVNGHEYHYLVRSVRRDGKVCQETLAYLGEFATVKEALEGLTGEAEKARQSAARCLEWSKTRHRSWLDWHERFTHQAERLEARIRKLRPFAV